MLNMFRLSLLGLVLTMAAAQVIRKGNCPNVRPVRNFDVNKMVGLWYLQYMYYYCPQNHFECSVFNMSLTTINGSQAFQFTEDAFDDTDSRLRTRVSIKIINPTNPALVTSYSYSSCFNDTQSCKYVSVGNNYNFFIIYCCKPYDIPNFKYETLGIRTRVQKMDRDLQRQIARAMFFLGLDKEFLLPVLQNCTESALSVAASSTTASSPTSTTVLPASATIPPASASLPPATATLPSASASLPPATATLPPASASLPPATATLPPASASLPPATGSPP